MKTIKISILVIAVICLTSCRKKYTCACQAQLTFDSGSGLTTSIYKDDSGAYSKKMYRKTAQSSCDAEKTSMQVSYQNALTDNGNFSLNPGEGVTVVCTLN